MPKLITAFLLVLISGIAAAQPAARFEVASVKPSVNPTPPLGISGGPGTSDPTRTTAHGANLTQILFRAYASSITGFDQISGPSWMNSQMYEVLATIPAGATKVEVEQMWRNLLSDRFHIQTHWTKKEFPGYELVIAKNGPKLKPSANPDASDQPPPPLRPEDLKLDKESFAIPPPGRRYFEIHPGRATRLTFRDSTMSELAQRLGLPLGTLSGPGITTGRVEDKTGLTGRYDFTLKFSGGMYPGEAFVSPTPENGLDEDRDGPGLFDALQSQLGLRLIEKKLSLDVLVVDHADKVPKQD